MRTYYKNTKNGKLIFLDSSNDVYEWSPDDHKWFYALMHGEHISKLYVKMSEEDMLLEIL